MHEASILGRTAASHFWGMMGSVGGRGWGGKVDGVVGCSGMERFFMRDNILLIYRVRSNKVIKYIGSLRKINNTATSSKDSKININNI